MPERERLGAYSMSTMAFPMSQSKDLTVTIPAYSRSVMGFCLPSWQRGFIWTEAQQIAFIESAWLGLNLGTFTYNVGPINHPLDNLLIDGQQRLRAIECYLTDQFPVFGFRWSEVTDIDRRIWSFTTIFANYRTETTDESYLRDYYNMMNFGGTPHNEDERA